MHSRLTNTVFFFPQLALGCEDDDLWAIEFAKSKLSSDISGCGDAIGLLEGAGMNCDADLAEFGAAEGVTGRTICCSTCAARDQEKLGQ